jgi:hypothetical protein
MFDLEHVTGLDATKLLPGRVELGNRHEFADVQFVFAE